MQPVVWIIIALLVDITAKEITICNCTEAENLGIMNFKYEAEC